MSSPAVAAVRRCSPAGSPPTTERAVLPGVAGPTNPAFFAIMADCEFDSFLTIGMDGPARVPGALSSIGIDFASWTETQGMTLSDGAVFFMDPDHGAELEPVVFLQLTVPTGTQFSGQLSAQGRSNVGEDWEIQRLRAQPVRTSR